MQVLQLPGPEKKPGGTCMRKAEWVWFDMMTGWFKGRFPDSRNTRPETGSNTLPII